jgi:hypothetical protein
MAKRRIFSRKKKTARCQVIGRFFMRIWGIVFSLSLFIVSYPQRGILNAPIIKNGFAILQIAICKYHLQLAHYRKRVKMNQNIGMISFIPDKNSTKGPINV